MSAPAFTPGPWHARRPWIRAWQYVVGRPEPGPRFTLAKLSYVDGHPLEAEANAHLISAAPDLHYVAVLVTELASILGENNAVVNLAREALAKARGQS